MLAVSSSLPFPLIIKIAAPYFQLFHPDLTEQPLKRAVPAKRELLFFLEIPGCFLKNLLSVLLKGYLSSLCQ